MSANNYIEIKWKNPSYHVAMRDAETGSQLGKRIATCKKLERAIELANEVLTEEIVEYGLSIKVNPNWNKKNETVNS